MLTSDLLTVAEVAEMLRVHDSTIRRWIDLGILRAIRPSPTSKSTRIARQEVERLLDDGLSEPAEAAS